MTTTYHDESLRDRAAMLALRGLLALQPSLVFGPEARPGFDELMARTPPADGVETTPAIVGGVAGWCCWPLKCWGGNPITAHDPACAEATLQTDKR